MTLRMLSIRVPEDLIRRMDEAMKVDRQSRSAWIIRACELRLKMRLNDGPEDGAV